MSIRSNEMTAIRTVAGLYQTPSVRFGTGNQILQIRDNPLIPIADLEAEVIDVTNQASSQQSQALQLFQDTDTLFNNVTQIIAEEQTALALTVGLQAQLNQINQLLKVIEDQTTAPYYNAVLPAKTFRGVGTVNSTLPNDVAVYTFTPDPNNQYNVPSPFLTVSLPTYDSATQYQVSWNLCFIGDVRQGSNSEIFYQSFINASNGGIIYTTVTTPTVCIYASQKGTLGQTFIPPIQGSDTGSLTACALLNFTDIINVPANTPTLQFNFFISSHYSTTLSSTTATLNPYGGYLVNAFPTPQTLNIGVNQAVPALTLLKL